MPVIKVKDLAYGRLRAPDLDAQEEFLTHFGMVRSARTPNAAVFRFANAIRAIYRNCRKNKGPLCLTRAAPVQNL